MLLLFGVIASEILPHTFNVKEGLICVTVWNQQSNVHTYFTQLVTCEKL